MTEKRFVYYEHKGADYILDTPNLELDFIEMLGDALEAEEIVDKLNELVEENKKLKELVREVDNEIEIRDIVCGAGKFRLEEWGKHRYHQFYKGDEELEDETVVIMLMELEKENKELKEHQNINCQNCQYFISDSASSTCLKREDIGYKGTYINGMDLHKLAKNCPYYLGGNYD